MQRNVLAATLTQIVLASLLFETVQASDIPLRSDRSQCYSYLTDIVRSSSFPFTSVEKDKTNLLIDDDQGEIVSA